MTLAAAHDRGHRSERPEPLIRSATHPVNTWFTTGAAGVLGRMKVTVDREKCTGLGICESLAPDVFEIDDDGTLVLNEDAVSRVDVADIEAAVDGCPTAALRLVRE
jgi:ferredoxin